MKTRKSGRVAFVSGPNCGGAHGLLARGVPRDPATLATMPRVTIDLEKSVAWGRPAAEVVRAMGLLDWMDWAALPIGRHELDGDRLFAIVDEYVSKPPEQCRLEAHRRYHDIQLVLSGRERIGVAPLDGLRITKPYDEAQDVGFLEGVYETITLEAGQAAVFGPSDAHMPQMAAGEPGTVRKVVVKVAVELNNE